ncbi:MAG: hypothetical protein MJY99_10190 [Fibrobacter sp.]|uniref:hypothetical protein n=1 Tax=Fibrobacter sp. TaxID=35828 RepID=UPI00388F2276|nr:hypothetical protein [Fibrobacter sp.]
MDASNPNTQEYYYKITTIVGLGPTKTTVTVLKKPAMGIPQMAVPKPNLIKTPKGSPATDATPKSGLKLGYVDPSKHKPAMGIPQKGCFKFGCINPHTGKHSI